MGQVAPAIRSACIENEDVTLEETVLTPDRRRQSGVEFVG